jgi:hypothetical protein
VAILLTGIPSGLIAGFQNYTGRTYADELRLNMAIPPSTSNPSPLGLLGNDLAGFPNGRRVFDDITSVELLLTDGLTEANTSYLSTFPYLGTPQSGYQTAPLSAVS